MTLQSLCGRLSEFFQTFFPNSSFHELRWHAGGATGTTFSDLGRRQVANTSPTHAAGLFARTNGTFQRFAAHKSGLRATVPTLCYARPVGLKAKTAALFTIGPTTQRMLSKKTARMGDVGKAVGCVPPTALLCVRPPFCADRHFAKNQMRSD
jgi:hypothetical protein